MLFEHEHEHANQFAAIITIAPKIGCGRDTLRRWVKQSDIDNGRKDGQTFDARAPPVPETLIWRRIVPTEMPLLAPRSMLFGKRTMKSRAF